MNPAGAILQNAVFSHLTNCPFNLLTCHSFAGEFGSEHWIRTSDLAVNSRLLYQLSYFGISYGGPWKIRTPSPRIWNPGCMPSQSRPITSERYSPGIQRYPNTNCWWKLAESNPRPSACKADALPIELSPHETGAHQGFRTPDLTLIRGALYQTELGVRCCLNVVQTARFELATSRLSVERSTG